MNQVSETQTTGVYGEVFPNQVEVKIKDLPKSFGAKVSMNSSY